MIWLISILLSISLLWFILLFRYALYSIKIADLIPSVWTRTHEIGNILKENNIPQKFYFLYLTFNFKKIYNEFKRIKQKEIPFIVIYNLHDVLHYSAKYGRIQRRENKERNLKSYAKETLSILNKLAQDVAKDENFRATLDPQAVSRLAECEEYLKSAIENNIDELQKVIIINEWRRIKGNYKRRKRIDLLNLQPAINKRY